MYITDEEKYPVYVCRSGMGPYHIGYTEKRCQYYICIVPSRKELKVVEQYEVLINEGKVDQLIWKKWRKYEHIPHHAVVANRYVFIGRQKVDNEYGYTYNLARLKTDSVMVNTDFYVTISDKFGTVANDGEILVEEEPTRYDIKEIELYDHQN